MKKNRSIRALREITKLTQGELAVLIGASKIAVTSWERGAKRLSPRFAHRIHMATGANTQALLRGDGKNLGPSPNQPYAHDTFLEWRKTFGDNAQAVAEKYRELAEDSIALILRAAATPGAGKAKDRLPVVWLSLIQWMEKAVSNFKLLPEIEGQLQDRSYTDSITTTYGQMRANPSIAKSYGFKDHPKKPDSEKLTLECKGMRPGWWPGTDMRPPPGAKPSPPSGLTVSRLTFLPPKT